MVRCLAAFAGYWHNPLNFHGLFRWPQEFSLHKIQITFVDYHFYNEIFVYLRSTSNFECDGALFIAVQVRLSMDASHRMWMSLSLRGNVIYSALVYSTVDAALPKYPLPTKYRPN